MAKLTELQKLENRRERLEASYQKAATASREKFSKLGWGTGMRCSKINISFSKEDAIENKLNEVNELIKTLKNATYS